MDYIVRVFLTKCSLQCFFPITSSAPQSVTYQPLYSIEHFGGLVILLKGISTLFQLDVFPVNVVIVALCVMLTVLSSSVKRIFIAYSSSDRGELLSFLQLSR